MNFNPLFAGVDLTDLALPEISISKLNEEVFNYVLFLLCTRWFREPQPKLADQSDWQSCLLTTSGSLGLLYQTLIFKAFCVPEFRAVSIKTKIVMRWSCPGSGQYCQAQLPLLWRTHDSPSGLRLKFSDQSSMMTGWTLKTLARLISR